MKRVKSEQSKNVHTEKDVLYFAKAFNECLQVYIKALDEGYEGLLIGSPAKAVFRKTL